MNRLVRLQLVFFCCFALLILRLVHLQVLHGARYRQLSDSNRLRLVPEPAPRGVVYDRRDRIIASNESLFRVALVPQELEDLPAVLDHLSRMVRRAPEVLNKDYKKAKSLSFMPATVVSHVPKDLAIRLEEDRWAYPGLLINPDAVRAYPHGAAAAHLLGHLSQPTPDELPALKVYGVRPQQLVGRLGLERMLEPQLRGRHGGTMIEVNHRGRQVRVIGQRPSEPGQDARLTVDIELQSLIQELFGGAPGAAVVLEPRTGAVVAMVSSPSFRPEAFVLPDTALIRQYLSDPLTPMMNRAAMGAYQPGSIIKLITAAVALEENVVTPYTTINCAGGLTLGDRTFHCWNRDGHGPMNLRDAIMQSCNVYFMQVARKLGVQKLRAGMERVGLGHKTGWPLGEAAGHLPTRRLSEGELCLLAIGQGEILVTPLQAAAMAGVFATHGTLTTPWVVRELSGRAVPPPRAHRTVEWSEQTFAAVQRGMEAVVLSQDGTGHRAFSQMVEVAAKTGTAQTHVKDKTHGWFVGFCPVVEPRVVFAVMAEFGGAGGDLPAEVARGICEYVMTEDTL